MPLNYGVLKGTVAGHLRDADDDHYQILVHAGGTVHRIACNVKSAAPKAPSTVLFQAKTTLPVELTAKFKQLALGFTKAPPKAGGVAMDYVRGGIVKPSLMKPVPPDVPGVNNDLKDKVENAVLKAMHQEGSLVYALGAKWGPEKAKADQYFRFLPGNGIHDIHMNQGNSGSYKKDNGVWQDGALVFSYPDGKWLAFFFAFQSQTFDTDEKGNPKAKPREGERLMVKAKVNGEAKDKAKAPPGATASKTAKKKG
jgi:uncharacterized protein YukJ